MNSKRSLVPLLVCLTCALWLLGCGREYGETSENGYRLARTLYNVCNLQQAEQLETLRSLIETQHADGKLGTREHNELLGILDVAEAERWEEAQQMTRKLLADQQNR